MFDSTFGPESEGNECRGRSRIVVGLGSNLAISGGSSSWSRPHQAQTASHARDGRLGGLSRMTQTPLAPPGPLSDVERGLIPEGQRRQHET